MGYIYKITNDVNDKVYIGQTSKSRPTDRWSQHKTDSKTLKDSDNSALHAAMHKFGVEHFFFEIIEEVPIESLDEREIYWIAKMNSQVPTGYNISSGGKVPRGFPSKFKGIPRTEEVKQKLRNNWTQERREEQSKRVSGENNPMFGKITSEETKQKLREALSGEKNPFYGKHHSEETKIKLSQLQKPRKKSVVQKDINSGKIICIYESISSAAKAVNGDDSYIGKACRHKADKSGSNRAYGFQWDFVKDVSTNCSVEISTTRSEDLPE